MTHPLTRFPLGRLLIRALPIVLMAAAGSASAGLKYDMTFTWTGGGSGEQIYQVIQVGETSLAMQNGEPRMYSSPEAGILLVQKPMMGTNIPLWISDTPPERVKTGSRLPSSSGGTELIESISFSLEPGTSPDREVEGLMLKHHVLTIDMDWTWFNSGEQKQRTLAKADLWTAESQPFSWLPYGEMSREGAMPALFNHPKVASWVRAELAEDLMSLGLLVQADVAVDFISREQNFRQEYRREVRLSNIETIETDTPAMPMPAYLNMDRYRAFFGAYLGGPRLCMGDSIAVPFDVAKISADSVKLRTPGKSPAITQSDGDRTDIILGGLQRDAETSTCAIVTLKSPSIESGKYEVAAEAHRDALAEGQVKAVVITGNRETMTIAVTEAGTLRLKGKGPEYSGRLKGSGWSVSLQREPSKATVNRDVEVEISFSAAEAPEAASD